MNPRDPPSKILLLIITYLPQSFPLTNDFLFETFKQYGEIKKILIFERGKTNKAFVEYSEVKHAIQARRNMLGKSLTPQGGRLLIHYSRLRQLDLEVVDHSRGTKYDQDDEETQPEPFYPKQPMTLPTAAQKIQPLIKPQTIEYTEKTEKTEKIPLDESPTKAIMETQLRQLERILDDDYAEEAAKTSYQTLDYGQQIIKELLIQQPSKYLKVSNIDDRVTHKMLFNLFNRFGHLKFLQWKKSNSCAILCFVNIEHATIAKELLNNVLFFGKELRILFYTGQEIDFNSSNEDFYTCNSEKQRIVPLSKTLIFTGIPQLLEIQDMVKLVGRIQEIKLETNFIQIMMTDIYEALKVISVFSDYEYKGNRINLKLQ